MYRIIDFFLNISLLYLHDVYVIYIYISLSISTFFNISMLYLHDIYVISINVVSIMSIIFIIYLEMYL